MHAIDPNLYQQQLAEKHQRILRLFGDITLPEIRIFESQPLNFRMRAEFRIWHQGEKSFYAMTPSGQRSPSPIDDFAIGSKAMVTIMPPLLDAINSNPALRKKLYGCEFLTTQTNEVLVTLIYHRPLDDLWLAEAQSLATTLKIDLIGRSKKQKLVIGKDFVTESLSVAGKTYQYQQVETGFTQPNAQVNEKMLAWAKQVTAQSNGDLLELYCGNGNFTVILSENYRRVLATEVSKLSVRSAEYNLSHNGIDNVAIVRMSSEELTQALNGVRPFTRLKNIDLESYEFSTIFVDPPRAGLDAETLALAKKFEQILYISCNPITLKENINALKDNYEIHEFAIFDQFPYTHHIECGALLKNSTSN
ncbi:MAG: tRNA (uridine(54)-C5)-methyltransferase TrmA [Porticoccaceae bacterium]